MCLLAPSNTTHKTTQSILTYVIYNTVFNWGLDYNMDYKLTHPSPHPHTILISTGSKRKKKEVKRELGSWVTPSLCPSVNAAAITIPGSLLNEESPPAETCSFMKGHWELLISFSASLQRMH